MNFTCHPGVGGKLGVGWLVGWLVLVGRIVVDNYHRSCFGMLEKLPGGEKFLPSHGQKLAVCSKLLLVLSAKLINTSSGANCLSACKFLPVLGRGYVVEFGPWPNGTVESQMSVGRTVLVMER